RAALDQGLVVGVPVGSAVTFRSGLGHAAILPSCGGEGFVQQRPLFGSLIDMFLIFICFHLIGLAD
ncbi:hypothetical protein, partial [Chromobacterium violaceum]|uniref:hypothetical protein n=1 Tax=Chromobacterium violaceum TaxID=536 RepID=UPI001C384D77